MAFTNNFRIERVYFERLKTMIDVLKAFKDNVTDEPTRTILENSIDVDGATLLLYRNLGEAWAELADLIQKTRELLQSLDEKTEKYHDELNERIDEVNNYLMALIRALEARVDAIESDLAQMGRLFTYELTRVNDSYTLTESGNPVTFSDTAAKYAHNRAHLVTVRGNVDGETTYFFPREYDTSTESGLFEWYAFGFVGNEIHEITVTLLPDDTVNVAIETTNFTAILSRLSALETSVNSLIQRMTNAEADIDTLEATAENLEANKQDKLIAGSGISIDPETNEITNTAQGATYKAGNNIEIVDETINNTLRGYRLINVGATGLISSSATNLFYTSPPTGLAILDNYTLLAGSKVSLADSYMSEAVTYYNLTTPANALLMSMNAYLNVAGLASFLASKNIPVGLYKILLRFGVLKSSGTVENPGDPFYFETCEIIGYFNGSQFIVSNGDVYKLLTRSIITTTLASGTKVFKDITLISFDGSDLSSLLSDGSAISDFSSSFILSIKTYKRQA